MTESDFLVDLFMAVSHTGDFSSRLKLVESPCVGELVRLLGHLLFDLDELPLVAEFKGGFVLNRIDCRPVRIDP